MKTTRTIAGVLLVVVAIIAIGSAARNFRRLQSAQAATEAETRRHDAVRRQIDELQSDAVGTKRDNEAPRAEGPSVASAKSEAMKTTNVHPESARAKIDNSALSAQSQSRAADRPLSTNPAILTAIDPEARVLAVKLEEARVEIAWGPLFAALNLSPERIEKFKAIRMAQRQDSLDYEALADTKPLGLRDPEIEAQRRAGLEATEQQMRSLFSPEEFQAYDAYNKGERNVSQTVEQLAAQLYFTESPLSAQQGLRLMRLLAEYSPRGPQGFVAALNPNQLNSAINAALAQMTTAEFSPVQIAALRKMRDQQQAQQQIQREMSQRLGAISQRHGVEPGSLSYPNATLPGRDYSKRTNPPR